MEKEKERENEKDLPDFPELEKTFEVIQKTKGVLHTDSFCRTDDLLIHAESILLNATLRMEFKHSGNLKKLYKVLKNLVNIREKEEAINGPKLDIEDFFAELGFSITNIRSSSFQQIFFDKFWIQEIQTITQHDKIAIEYRIDFALSLKEQRTQFFSKLPKSSNISDLRYLFSKLDSDGFFEKYDYPLSLIDFEYRLFYREIFVQKVGEEKFLPFRLNKNSKLRLNPDDLMLELVPYTRSLEQNFDIKNPNRDEIVGFILVEYLHEKRSGLELNKHWLPGGLLLVD
jgi:hypothetical protein